MYFMGIYFFANMVSTSLISTGAFEVYVDDREVFSKLKTGKMIESPDLHRVLAACGLDL